MSQPFTFQIPLSDDYETAVEKVTTALKTEGFGVLTTVDMKATLKKKLDADFRRYVILGVCNPPLAYRALQRDARVGLLLPCNVVVEESESGSLVSIVNPEAALGIGPLSEDPEIKAVAAEARARLERVAAALAA
jgi:uncharacterized protein (DUF302 family)